MNAPTIRPGAGIQFIQGELASMLSIDPVIASIIRQTTPRQQSPYQYNIDFNVSVESVDDKDVLVVSPGNIQGLGFPADAVFRRTQGASFANLEPDTSGVLYLEIPIVETQSSESSYAGEFTTPAPALYNHTITVTSNRVYPDVFSGTFKIAALFPVDDSAFLRIRIADYSVDEDGLISFELLRFGSVMVPNVIFIPSTGARTSFRAA